MKNKRLRLGITGSTGVLGQAFLSRLSNYDLSCFRGDLSDISEVATWYRSAGALDAVFHFAAIVPVQTVQENPLRAFEVNVLGTLNLLETIRKNWDESKPWVFYCSSSHVYATSPVPLTEESKVEPITIYGTTKAQAEKWCQVYGEFYGMRICIGRVFSNSSPKQHPSYFIPSMIEKIKKAERNEVLEVKGLDGTRDFLTPDQISDAVIALFKKEATGVFNIGTGHAVRLLDIAQGLRDKLNRQDLKIKSTGADINHLVANVGKINGLGLKLDFDLNSFLDSVLAR